jgi:formylglycine-generating enzyme
MTDRDYHTETINNHTFRLRHLPGGIFDMGSNETEKAIGKESPIHKVELSPFYIGEYPVTQALWKAVMGVDHNPSRFIGDSRSVEQVSWVDIVEGNQNDNGQPAFLQKLNEWTVTSRPRGYVYRLPTEAEWE